jgi:quercetin dioxygenase-like cupin family protein
MNRNQTTFFPEMITRHPEVDIPKDGVSSRLIQAGQQQFIFMEFDRDLEVPVHSHNTQWGVVLEGQIELTIDGQTRIFTKGDSYFVDRMHSAKIKKGYKDLTLFDQADRYKVL